MSILLTVIGLEWKLLWRGRGLWVAAVIMALFGVWEASSVREAPYGAWGQFAFTAWLVTLILTFTTGDQIHRDEERRLDGVLLSTPVTTTTYVWGKFLAALLALLALSGINLVAAILMDHFDSWRTPPAILGHSIYPSLGPWPYLAGWFWLDLTPLIFGAALTLVAITLSRGQRILAAAGALLLWLLPAFFSSWPLILDVGGEGMNYVYGLGGSNAAFQYANQHEPQGGPEASVAAHVVQLVQASLPPSFPDIFYWNRALFLCLAVLGVMMLAFWFGRQRQGRAWGRQLRPSLLPALLTKRKEQTYAHRDH
jgi:hypothetical protein